MAKRGPKPKTAKKPLDGKGAEAYKHTEEKLLLRPDVGLQSQFKRKKPPKTYRYDPSLDPTLSWDGTVSEPFAAGEHKKVAVKVIDDRGNELMVVKALDEAEPER